VRIGKEALSLDVTRKAALFKASAGSATDGKNLSTILETTKLIPARRKVVIVVPIAACTTLPRMTSGSLVMKC